MRVFRGSRILLPLFGLVLIGVTVSIFVGSRLASPAEVLAGLISADSELGPLVWQQRIPRTALAATVGAAFGLAGAAIQAHTRNPLADPSTLGITSGAALGVVTGIHLLGIGSVIAYVWFALAGAAVVAAVVFWISAIGGGGASPLSLILAGAALTATCTAVTTMIVLSNTASLEEFRFWNTGSLVGRDLGVLVRVAPFLGVGALLVMISAPALNLLATGDQLATGLGVRVRRQRILGAIAITLLAGAATAAAGPLAFIGLMVPHLVRPLTGIDHRVLLPASALAGAVVVLLADTVARLLVWPAELQVGVVLAVIGAPFFIALVRRRRLVMSR